MAARSGSVGAVALLRRLWFRFILRSKFAGPPSSPDFWTRGVESFASTKSSVFVLRYFIFRLRVYPTFVRPPNFSTCHFINSKFEPAGRSVAIPVIIPSQTRCSAPQKCDFIFGALLLHVICWFGFVCCEAAGDGDPWYLC